MKPYVTFEARDLAKAMKPVMAIIERRNTIPILSCVRIKSGKAGCYLYGTDLDIFLDITMPRMDWSGEIDLALDARVVFKIARASGVMPMRFEVGSEKSVRHHERGKETIHIPKILISAGYEFSYNLFAHKPDDFPTFPGGDDIAVLTSFDAGALPALFDKVKSAISTEETRYYLNGVCWEIGAKGSYFVATDGHRLSAVRYADGVDYGERRIIPRKAVVFICQHLRRDALTVHSHEWAHPAMRIVAPGFVMRFKLIDGTFPDWHRVVPSSHTAEWAMRRKEMTQAISQISAIASDKTRSVKFDNESGKLSVSHISPDFGAAQAITQVPWPVRAFHFGAKRDYFLSMMASCDEEFTLQSDGDGSAPLVFVDSDERMTRVLMPMHV